MQKGEKLFYCSISVPFPVAVKYQVGAGSCFITTAQPGLQELAKIGSCEIF